MANAGLKESARFEKSWIMPWKSRENSIEEKRRIDAKQKKQKDCCQGPLRKERTDKFEDKRKEKRILLPKNWHKFTMANGKH